MFLSLLIIFGISTFAYCSEQCDEDCTSYVSHYYEFGCKPIYENGKCCPIRFECPDFEKYDKTKCYFRGKTYELGEGLATEEEGNCRMGCRCTRSSTVDSQAAFKCAVVDCPERMNPDIIQDECIQQYALDACCLKNQVCDPLEIQALSTCYSEGDVYREGERIFPTGKCYNCICGADFDNSTSVDTNKYCAKINCDNELQFLDSIRKNCAPTYYTEYTCCPYTYLCPESDINATPNTLPSNAAQCKFGNLIFNLGEIIEQKDECITCKCETPPLVTCKTVQDCYAQKFESLFIPLN